MAKEAVLPTHEPAPSGPTARRSGGRPVLVILFGCIFALAFFKGETLLSAINRTTAICMHGNHQQVNPQSNLPLVQKIDDTTENPFIEPPVTSNLGKQEPAVLRRRGEDSAQEDTVVSTDGRSGYNRREEEDGRSGYNRLADTDGRSGYNRREDGRSGYNKVDDSGRSGYNRREETDGRSGYNKIGTDGRSGYNRREETEGRSGYNEIGTDGRSGYNRSF